jgi:hypothetical protein
VEFASIPPQASRRFPPKPCLLLLHSQFLR